MVVVPQFTNKQVAVFGLGKAGSAAVKALVKSGAKVFAWDDNAESVEKLKAEVKEANLAPPEKYDWKTISALVLSPGIPLTHPEPHKVVKLAQAANCPIVCDIELLYNATPKATYIGITGTNGKSTTTALIGHIFFTIGKTVAIGGNIGTAASSLPVFGEDGVYVLETSSYQLDLLSETRFNAAALLNITPDHIDRHGSMDGYIASKKKIFARQQREDFAIIAVDDPYTRSIYETMLKEGGRKMIPVSCNKEVEGGVSVINGVIQNNIYRPGEKLEIGTLKRLPGKHNAQNIAVAFATLACLGIRSESIVAGIRSFPGLKHRIEHVAEKDGVVFINDSKATNAEAAEKAISSFDNIFWIAGGKPKEGGINALAPLFPKIKSAFLIGEAQDDFANTLEGKVSYQKCGTLDKAVESAYKAAQGSGGGNGVVLLSPACASFDQFKSFEERGNKFCEVVNSLVGNK